MVRSPLSFEKTVSMMFLGLLTTTGCTSKSKDRSPDWSRNTAIVECIQNQPTFPADSEIEQVALKRFNNFYEEYSYEAIKSGVRELYADDAWFGDPFHIVEGIDDIEHYFLVMAEPVERCTFIAESVQRSGDEYFARWTMELESKAAKGELIKTIGISHVKFNEEGKVIFQQDYWDSSAMLDRLPIVGYWTRLVKDRIEKGLEK